jgi:hypothetical protein
LKETPTVLVPLERANFTYWITLPQRDPSEQVIISSHLKTETDPLSETLFSSYLGFRTMGEVNKASDS